MAAPSLVRSVRLEDGTAVNEVLPNLPPAADAALVPVSLVVDTSVTASSGNVFKTLAEAAAVRRTFDGPATVTFRQATIHPALAYDLRDASGYWNTTFLTAAGAILGQQFAAGSTLAGVTEFAAPINFLGLAGSALVTAPVLAAGTSPIFRTRGEFGMAATGGGDFFNPASGAPAAGQSSVWILSDISGGFAAGNAIWASRGLNAAIVLLVEDESFISSNTLVEAGGGTIFVSQASDGAVVNRTQANLATTGPNLTPGGNLALLPSTNNARGPGGGDPAVQAGTATLANGTATVATAVITATSRIVVCLKTPAGAGAATSTVYFSPGGATRVPGRPGSFTCQGSVTASGGPNAGDNSDVDWMIMN